MNKALNKYVNEIIAIAGENDVSWDVGVNMFLTNVKNYGKDDAPHYAGADYIDWDAVGAELVPFTTEDEADMINTYCEDYRKNMQLVQAARMSGDYDRASEIMVNA